MDKKFFPTTFIGWLTVATLFIGASASLYSSYTKPYHHIIDIEKRLVRLEDKFITIESYLERVLTSIGR